MKEPVKTRVYTSLLESMVKLDFQGARYTTKGEVADQQGNDHLPVPMGTEAKDGSCQYQAFRKNGRFCDALGAKELLMIQTIRLGRSKQSA